jgi:hypothetical protein
LRPAFDLIETIRRMTGRQDAFKAVRSTSPNESACRRQALRRDRTEGSVGE